MRRQCRKEGTDDRGGDVGGCQLRLVDADVGVRPRRDRSGRDKDTGTCHRLRHSHRRKGIARRARNHGAQTLYRPEASRGNSMGAVGADNGIVDGIHALLVVGMGAADTGRACHRLFGASVLHTRMETSAQRHCRHGYVSGAQHLHSFSLQLSRHGVAVAHDRTRHRTPSVL